MSKKEQKPGKETVSVKIGAFPGGTITPHTFPSGETYEQGLRKVELIGSGGTAKLDVRVNGTRLSSLEIPMKDGDQILVFANVRGN